MVEEMQALVLERRLGYHWVFEVKFNLDRSVAKGYAQTYGVDYSDTFSSIAKLTFVRLFISFVAFYD